MDILSRDFTEIKAMITQEIRFNHHIRSARLNLRRLNVGGDTMWPTFK